jgi:hypothetical protein
LPINSQQKEKEARVSDENKKLKLLHWNPNSVIGKIIPIQNLIMEIKPDIISFNETRTNGTTDSYLFDLAEIGYMAYVKNRPEKNEKLVSSHMSLPGGGWPF